MNKEITKVGPYKECERPTGNIVIYGKPSRINHVISMNVYDGETYSHVFLTEEKAKELIYNLYYVLLYECPELGDSLLEKLYNT